MDYVRDGSTGGLVDRVLANKFEMFVNIGAYGVPKATTNKKAIDIGKAAHDAENFAQTVSLRGDCRVRTRVES